LNGLNRLVTRVFDVLLAPLEWVGVEFSLLVVSAVFGVLALWVFKHISWQRGIRSTKRRITAHLLEIRIYQDDLGVVARALGKVLRHNVVYLGLNVVPFVPLVLPFALVVAQLVVRYAFEPASIAQVVQAQSSAQAIAGDGITVTIRGDAAAIEGLELLLPDGLVARTPLARVPTSGLAAQEFVATEPGEYTLRFWTAGGVETTKRFVAGGARPRTLQPERARGLAAWLWPAEESLAGTGLTEISFVYPESELGWLPGRGPFGVILVFVVASMLAGVVALRPLGVHI